MKRLLYLLPFLFVATLAQATEINTTAVNQALKNMLNPSGKWNKIDFADGTSQTGAAGASAAASFGGLTGLPADNQYFREVSGTATVPVRDANGNLHLQGNIVGSETVTNLNPTRINFQGTTTEMTGTQTVPVWYTLKKSKVSTSYVHDSPNVLLHLPADAGGSSTTLTDLSSYQAVVTAGAGAVSSSAYSKFGGASLYVPSGMASITNHPRYDLGTDTEFYISAWVKFDSIAANQYICARGTDTGGNSGWSIYYSGGAATGLAFRNQTAGVEDILIQQGGVAGWSAGTEYHIAIRRFTGGGYQLLRTGTVIASGTDTSSITNTGNLEIGNVWIGAPLIGYVDDFYFEKNTNGTSTVPTAAKAGTITTYYNSYSSYYIPANGSVPFLTIIDNGTQTPAVVQVIIGSTTPTSTATTDIKLEVSGKVYATQYISPSSESKKLVYPDGTKTNYLDELRDIRVGEWSWKEVPVNRLDAKAKAKKDYLQSNKAAWTQANKSNYSSTVSEPGTGTVTKIDKVKMDKDYKTYIELEWESLPEQKDLIDTVENKLAAGENPDRHLTPFAGDPTTPAIMQSKSKKELSLNDQIGWSIKVMKAQQKEIDSLKQRLNAGGIP